MRTVRARLVGLVALLCLYGSSALARQPIGPSAGVSVGSVSSRSSLTVVVARAAYWHRLSDRWSIGIEHPIVGHVIDSNTDESQSVTRFGSPLLGARAEWELETDWQLSVGGGLTLVPPRFLGSLDRPGEWVSQFVLEDIYSVISGQRDRWAFQPRIITAVIPVTVRYGAERGWFVGATLALDPGIADDFLLDLRSMYHGGYASGPLSAGVSVLAFWELIAQLGRTARGELDFRAGEQQQYSVEPFVRVRVQLLWFQVRGTVGRLMRERRDGVTTAAGHLDVGFDLN